MDRSRAPDAPDAAVGAASRFGSIRSAVGAGTGAAIGGGLGGVGIALLAHPESPVVIDVAFVVGVVVGVLACRLRPGLPIVVVGVAVYLLRLLAVQPAAVVGVVVAGAAAAGAGLLAHRLRATARVEHRLHVAVASVVATVAAVVATFVYGVYGVTRHLRFGSGSWDHGCYLHNAWLFAHGHAFSTTAVSSVLGDAAFWGGTNHFMPSLVLTAPLSWLMEATSSSSLLIVAQAVVVCAAAIPLAAIARHRGLPLLTTTALCVCFLFSMGVQAALLFDVHEIAPVPLLLLTVLWIAETRAPSPRAIAAVVALLLVLGGTKESSLLYAAAVGAWLLLFASGRWRVVGAVAVGVFAAAFVVVVAVVQPALLEPGSKGMIHLARFGPAGSSGGVANGLGGLLASTLLQPGQTLATLVSPDQKLSTLGVSGSGFGFLPFVSGEALVLGLPNLAERFLADKREMWGLGFHYGLVGAAVVAVGAAGTLTRLQRRAPARVHFDISATVFLLVSMVASFIASPTAPDLAAFEKPYYASAAEAARYRRALALIDDDDAVVAQNHFLPHLALREHIWLPEQRFVDRADVVVLDTAASPWPHDGQHVRRLVARLEADPRFTVAFREATTWVFQRSTLDDVR